MKKISERESTQSVSRKAEAHTLDKILEIEFRCSEAVGIRKNESSNHLNDIWQWAIQQNFSNIYGSLATVFRTFGYSSTIGQLIGLGSRGIRTAFLGSGEELPLHYNIRQNASPFIIHRFTPTGRLFPTPNFFQLVARTAQQAADFALIAHYLAEKSLCPGLVVHDLKDVQQEKVESLDLDSMLSFIGLPDDLIETPTSFQKELFGDRRRRIPDDPEIYLSNANAELFKDVPALCAEVFDSFAKLTGRSYNIIEQVKTDEADVIIVATGTNFNWISENLSQVNKTVDANIGIVHPVLISPFPGHLLSHILKGKGQVIAVSNNDNPDHDPVIQGIRNSLDTAIENGLSGKKPDIPYRGYAVFSKISDRPRLATFSALGREIDFKAFEEALQNAGKGSSSKTQFNITSEEIGDSEKIEEKKKQTHSPESEGGPKIEIKEEAAPEEKTEIPSGDNFRQLLSFFITGKTPHPKLEKHVGQNLKPVLFSQQENESSNNFPICLVKNSSGIFVKSLPAIFDEIVNKKSEQEEASEDVKEKLSALESRMESLVNGKKTGRLTELWDIATKSILDDIKEDEEKKGAIRNNLQEAKKKLQVDGEVLSLNTGFPQRVIEESLITTWTEKTSQFRDELNRLMSQLYDLLGIDPSQESDQSDSGDFGSSVASAFKDELDFQSFSQLVEESFEREPLHKNRRTRIQDVLKSLNALQPLYSVMPRQGRNGESYPSLFQFYCDSSNCAETIGQIQASIRAIIKFFRALHIAKLEVQNKYGEEKHQRFFSEYSVNHFTADDLALVPPILLHINQTSMDETSLAAVLDLISTDLPIKVALEIDDVMDQPDLLPVQINWSTKFATMAIALNNVYVFQSAVADGEQFTNGIFQGLKYSGPALFSIYDGSGATVQEDFPSIPLKRISAAAMETRAFPTILYDPLKSSEWGSRFSVGGNPQYQKDWVTKKFPYQNADGKDASVELAFTLVDFLGADKRFANHFLQVPRNRWHENMIPLQDYLKLKQEEAKYKLPYILMIGEDGTLHRVIPTRFMVRLAFSWLEKWRSLQELGLLKQETAPVEQARKTEIETVEEKYKEERAKSEKELKQEVISNLLTRLLGGDIKAPKEVKVPSAEGETAEAAEKPTKEAKEEEVAEIVEPYIDTPLCTTCNECTNINNRMFAYNENKQAYIKDAKAGTFKELVKAAEKCPARIIHPGKPKNPDEPGLDKLIKRAKRFN